MKDLDKYRGCLIGGAAGDALGYAVEFDREDSIFSKYGKDGITEYDLKDGSALISDDTQMTLFTGAGLLAADAQKHTNDRSETYIEHINLSYYDWYRTQTKSYPLSDEHFCSWLMNISETFALRAPGNTCLSALSGGKAGSIENPINQSKGCGGVMRVAPIGLYFDCGNDEACIKQTDILGAKAAALTHGHPLGYIPAAALTHIIQLLAHDDNITIDEAVEDMLNVIPQLFDDDKYMEQFVNIINKAVKLSKNNEISDLEAIKALGEGWVAEETLAIAIYCALKYSDDFEKGIIAAVNHGGDSDSTGSVAGNILGAYLGLKNIPQKFTENLELKDVILEIADDLYNNCQLSEWSSYSDPVWEQKYIYMTYPNGE